MYYTMEQAMRVFKYRNFSKWAKSEKVTDSALLKALKEIESGLVDADLGAGLFKKRLARQGMGKRGGYRVLLALKIKERAFFLHGFGKNERENIEEAEKKSYFDLAECFLGMTDQELSFLVKTEKLIEVKNAD